MPMLATFLRANWRTIAALLALLGAIWFLDHRGYRRAQEEQRAADAREAVRLSELRRALEQALHADLQGVADRLAARLRGVGEARTIVQPIIEREIARAPNLSSPHCSMPDSVRDALNAAARSGDDPGAARQRPQRLSRGAAAPRQLHGRPDPRLCRACAALRRLPRRPARRRRGARRGAAAARRGEGGLGPAPRPRNAGHVLPPARIFAGRA